MIRVDILYEFEGQISRTEECTATTIAPGIALTNYHCVPGFGPHKATRIRVVRNYLSDRQEEAPFTDDVVSIIDSSRDLDWTLFRYTERNSDTHLFPKFRAPIFGESIYLIGHPLAQGKVLSTGNCFVKSIQEKVFFTVVLL